MEAWERKLEGINALRCTSFIATHRLTRIFRIHHPNQQENLKTWLELANDCSLPWLLLLLLTLLLHLLLALLLYLLLALFLLLLALLLHLLLALFLLLLTLLLHLLLTLLF
jgi:hypothetical protein